MSCSSLFNLSFPRIQFILLQEGSVVVCERDPKVQRLYWNSTLQGNVARLPCPQENDNVSVDGVDPAAWLGDDVDSQKAIWSQLHPSPEEPSDHHHDSHSESEEGDETADGDKKPAAKPSESQGDNTSSSSSAAPAAADNNSSSGSRCPRPQTGSDNYVGGEWAAILASILALSRTAMVEGPSTRRPDLGGVTVIGSGLARILIPPAGQGDPVVENEAEISTAVVENQTGLSPHVRVIVGPGGNSYLQGMGGRSLVEVMGKSTEGILSTRTLPRLDLTPNASN